MKIGVDGARQLLQAGVNDLGGTLMDENISRAAGAEHGQGMEPERLRRPRRPARPPARPAHHAVRRALPRPPEAVACAASWGLLCPRDGGAVDRRSSFRGPSQLQDAGRQARRDRWRVTRRGTGRIVYVVPLVACALGLVAAGSIWVHEQDQARQRNLQAANQVATTFSQMASATIDGLRGASALLADDGVLSAAELATFADDMARQADLRAVAHELVVEDADRAAFEEEYGFAISDIGPDGTLVPAAAASRVRARGRRGVRRPVGRAQLRTGHPRRHPARRGRQGRG